MLFHPLGSADGRLAWRREPDAEKRSLDLLLGRLLVMSAGRGTAPLSLRCIRAIAVFLRAADPGVSRSPLD